MKKKKLFTTCAMMMVFLVVVVIYNYYSLVSVKSACEEQHKTAHVKKSIFAIHWSVTCE